MPGVETLEDLYEQMYELTHGHCGCEGTGQHGCGCCATFHCLKAQQFAREHYGIELQPTGHPVMFMGENGCTVAPHLRPICTLHACCISYAAQAGFPEDTGRTERYGLLRTQILDLSKTQNKFPFERTISGMQLTSEQGAVIAIVHADGTVDVWDVPFNAAISVTPQKGFGGVTQSSVSVALVAAEADIDSQLAHIGAL